MVTSNPTVARLASLTVSRAAQEAALAREGLRPQVLTNPSLDTGLLRRLLAEPKLSVADAKALVGRRLPQEVFQQLLATEKRQGVILESFKSNIPTLEDLHVLLENRALAKDKLVTHVAKHFEGVVDVDWLRAAGQVSGRARMMYWLAAPGETTNEEISAALAEFTSWGPEWPGELLSPLLADRPALLPAAARSDSLKVRTAAAGCRHLTDPGLQRQLAELDSGVDFATASGQWLEERKFIWVSLVCNPACDMAVVRELRPVFDRLGYDSGEHYWRRTTYQDFQLASTYQDEQDPRVLEWLIRRTLGSSKLRWWDFPALAANPHLGEAEAFAICHRLREHLPGGLEAPVAKAALGLLDRFPAEFADAGITREDIIQRPAPLPRASALLDPQPRQFGPEDLAKFGTEPLAVFRGWREEALTRYLESALNDTPQAWTLVMSLLEDGFDQTLADLADSVNAIISV